MVYNDINKSDYSFKYDNLVFYFSSKLYLEKFVREYSQFLKDEIIKIKLKYQSYVYCDEMILLLLYKKIEKRGFRVLYNNKPLKKDYYFIMSIDDSSYEG